VGRPGLASAQRLAPVPANGGGGPTGPCSPVGDFLEWVAWLAVRATVSATSGTGAPTVAMRLAASAVAPAGWSQTEVVCHDMQKKVIPFSPRKAAPSRPVTPEQSRIMIQVGAQRYSLNVPCNAMALPPEPAPPTKPHRLQELQVQTCFLRLGHPARLGDRIDGWRVCWVGGWDQGKVLFIVMAERVVGAGQS
jgi:hypothetical protein